MILHGFAWRSSKNTVLRQTNLIVNGLMWTHMDSPGLTMDIFGFTRARGKPGSQKENESSVTLTRAP